ncbi:Mu transposase C-terminal domain-containing protein [Rhizobium ruizarguesonis]|nr:Mu transposase C-terminal domain-containing protein [Rhizobium ruizarguesonis]
MTLDELERWLALQIVGRYHAEVHSALLLPPRTAWNDAVAARVDPLRLPHDPDRFCRDFLPFNERCIRRDGLHLFGIRYWDDVLSPLAGRSARQVRVKFDPRDLSCVYVEQEDGSVWPVRFAALDRPPITLGEHRLARAALRERGVRSVDENWFSTPSRSNGDCWKAPFSRPEACAAMWSEPNEHSPLAGDRPARRRPRLKTRPSSTCRP